MSEHSTERDARAPMQPLFVRLPGTRLMCRLLGHVWAPEWWAREQFDKPSVCLRCRVIPSAEPGAES